MRQSSKRDPLRPTLLLFLGGALAVGVGCSRGHYFYQADREAARLVQEKSNDPRWALPDFSVGMDTRSRYYEPYHQICPPMPEDDPASHRYMECVDGKRGWSHWHEFGHRSELENPSWRAQLGEYVELTDDGAMVLSLNSAMDVALINSPGYQNQLETIYLSALDVSTERFRFDVQFFGANDTNFTHQGRLRPGGESSALENSTDLLLRRRFATAGELLVGFANSFVWQFAGPDANNTMSIVNFNLVQPLLRRAGRDVALEQLTIAERTLLSNLRAFQRYRHGFYTQLAIGNLGVSGPQRRGGFFGGTGLTGFTGTGSGGFGGVGESTGFGRAGFGGGGAGAGGGTAGFAGGGAGQVGGFVGLLQQLQQIRNTDKSLKSQLQTLDLLEAHLEAGIIDLTQVDQFRQSIETERANLLQARNALEDALDDFKRNTLGVPPDVPVVLDDSMITQFQFIDPAVDSLQNRLNDFLEAFGEEPAEPDLDILAEALDAVTRLRLEAAEQLREVDADLNRLSDFIDPRRQEMEPGQSEQFLSEMDRLGTSFDDLSARLTHCEAPLEKLRDSLTAETRAPTADGLVELTTELESIVGELALVQARARLEMVTIEPTRLPPEVALEIARANRLDWMNNRAALVDTWRLIEFNADALQSDLQVTFSGDLRTARDNPVSFRAPTGRLSVGLEFDGPFTRLLERNNFRQVLIDYQRDRRQLIQYEDGVYQTLRNLVRQLEQLSVNLEIQRRAVAIAIRRVDQTQEALREPPPPSQPGQPSAQLGPTAALNLLTALSDLRSSQNNFMSVWLNYYAAKMTLYRELGIMELDDHNMWADRPLSEVGWSAEEGRLLPPPVPAQLFQQLDLRVSPEGRGSQRSGPPAAPSPPDLPFWSAHTEDVPERDSSPRRGVPGPHDLAEPVGYLDQ